MSALLGLVDRAQRVAVTGVAATKGWARSVRELILGIINSEPENSSLKAAFSRSIFGVPAPDLEPVAFSERRQEGKVREKSSSEIRKINTNDDLRPENDPQASTIAHPAIGTTKKDKKQTFRLLEMVCF